MSENFNAVQLSICPVASNGASKKSNSLSRIISLTTVTKVGGSSFGELMPIMELFSLLVRRLDSTCLGSSQNPRGSVMGCD